MTQCIPIRQNRIHPGLRESFALLLAGMLLFFFSANPMPAQANNPITFGILMANDTRQDPVEGFKEGMQLFQNMAMILMNLNIRS